MNKRQLVDHIKEAQAQACNNWERPIDLHNMLSTAYKECKEVARINGYTGACFVELWNRATHENEIAMHTAQNGRA